MNIDILPERAGDADGIHHVVQCAFRVAEHSSGTEHHIVRELRRAGALTISLVAVVDGMIVGHVAVSPVAISDGSAGWYGLGPVAVMPSHQNRGIGRALVGKAVTELRHRAAAGCVVLGEPSYYSRFGFRIDPALVLEGVPPGYFQTLLITARPPSGTVTYHPGFAAAS